jgi:hypothetical protein
MTIEDLSEEDRKIEEAIHREVYGSEYDTNPGLRKYLDSHIIPKMSEESRIASLKYRPKILE